MSVRSTSLPLAALLELIGHDSADHTARAAAADVVGGVSVDAFAGADSEAKLVAALASGEKQLFIPPGTTIALTAAHNVPASTTLLGYRGATITQAGASENCLVLNGNDITIEGITFTCPGTAGSYSAFNGAALKAHTKTNLTIRRCKVTNHRMWGIVLVNSADVIVEECEFASANVPVDLSDPEVINDTMIYADVGIIGSSLRAKIVRNYLHSGQSHGLLVQTLSGTAVTVGNHTINDNVIDGCCGYGIALYGQNLMSGVTQIQGTGQDTFRGTVIHGNHIKNISGEIQGFVVAAAAYKKFRGTGIYLQGVTGTIVSNNDIDTVCTLTDYEFLAPAGIGITNMRSGTVAHNIVRSSGWYGYYYSNPNDSGLAGDELVSTGNQALDSGKSGFRLNNHDRLVLNGDSSHRNTTYGFESRGSGSGKDYHRYRDCVATYNTLDGFNVGGSQALRVNYMGCSAENNGQHGFAPQNGTVNRLGMVDCEALANTQRGFSLGSSITVERWSGNRSSNNGTNYQLLSDVPDGLKTDSSVSGDITTMAFYSPTKWLLTGILTASRAFTLPTFAVQAGQEFTFTRAAGATGAFDLNFGTGTITAHVPAVLVATLSTEKTWCRVAYDGSAWKLVAQGTLP